MKLQRFLICCERRSCIAGAGRGLLLCLKAGDEIPMLKMSSFVKIIFIFLLPVGCVRVAKNGECVRAPPSGLLNSTLKEVFFLFSQEIYLKLH